MTIKYLSFICFVGRILLDPSTSSSSSSMTSSFLIQMLRWIKGFQELSSSYSSLLEGYSLNNECLIFSCSHLLFSYYELIFFLCKALAAFPFGTRTSLLMWVSNSFSSRMTETQYFHVWNLSFSPRFSSRWCN